MAGTSSNNNNNNNNNNQGFSDPDITLLRQAAERTLDELHRASQDPSTGIRSWIQPDTLVAVDATNEMPRFFHHAGFVQVPRFVDPTECQRLKNCMARLVDEQWHPGQEQQPLDSFGTDHAQNTRRGDYFLESAERVHYFCEPQALVVSKDDNAPPQLAEAYQSNKFAALNKAGHALHLLPDGPFAEYSHSPRIQQLVIDLGWTDPVIPQSMYIFKQAVAGGIVHSHQDSTFLFTQPQQTCLGLWLALDDATLDNGCLWVRPGSHREPVRRQYQRNPKYFGTENNDVHHNDKDGTNHQHHYSSEEPQFVMHQLVSPTTIPWDGAVPGEGRAHDLLQAGFIPIECQAGDLLAFVGTLDHLSLQNHSDSPRHTFQLHLVEGPAAGVVWSDSNWLQYANRKPFVRLFGDD